jgi:hypothetical protein
MTQKKLPGYDEWGVKYARGWSSSERNARLHRYVIERAQKKVTHQQREAESYRENKAQIQAFKNAADLEKKARRAKKKRGGIEPLIRDGGGWWKLQIKEEDARRLEQRDALAMRMHAKGVTAPCPLTRYRVRDGRNSEVGAFTILAEVRQQDSNRYKEIGSLRAYPDFDGGPYVVHWSSTPYSILATCPGLGTKLYEAAAREACKRGSWLAGSPQRSPFSEKFWKRQIQKGRAVCGGGGAEIYDPPVEDLRDELNRGKITVPQYNKLRRNLPRMPESRMWPCRYVPLTACQGPARSPRLPKDGTLRGVKKR